MEFIVSMGRGGLGFRDDHTDTMIYGPDGGGYPSLHAVDASDRPSPSQRK